MNVNISAVTLASGANGMEVSTEFRSEQSSAQPIYENLEFFGYFALMLTVVARAFPLP
jgi:hypothetical protein